MPSLPKRSQCWRAVLDVMMEHVLSRNRMEITPEMSPPDAAPQPPNFNVNRSVIIYTCMKKFGTADE